MQFGKIAMLFPGQGACYPGVLRDAAKSYPQVRNTIEEIDAVSRARFGQTVADLIWKPAVRSVEHMLADAADVFQLAIYAISVSTFKMLVAEGVLPDLVMGHSLGEIAALVSAGAFTVREGAEIVCDRAEAIRSAASVARIHSPYPFHSPLMEPARQRLSESVRRFAAKPSVIPVFSPILGRYYDGRDDLTQCLAGHLTQPVRFAHAIERVYSEGVRTFIEVGALDTLTNLVAKTLPATDEIRTVAILNRSADEVGSIRGAVSGLRGDPPATSTTGGLDASIPAEHSADFWREHRLIVEQFIQKQYEVYRGNAV